MEAEKVARTLHNPHEVMSSQFQIGDHDVRVVLVPPKKDEPIPEDYVVGVEDRIDSEGNRLRRFAKVPIRVREAGHAVVEFYDSHEKLIKGIGATAVVSGAVTVGSLFVKRIKKQRD